MPLSVSSALARQTVDPWREVIELARFPRDLSVRRLSALIEVLPEGPASGQNPKTAATRLIALLPRVPRFEFSPCAACLGSAAVTKRPSTTSIVRFLLAIVVGTRLLAAGSHAPPKIASARTLPISTDVPKAALPNHGRSDDRARTTGGTMAEDNTQPNTNEPHDQTRPDQTARQLQQSQTNGTVESDRATPRVRKSLFRR